MVQLLLAYPYRRTICLLAVLGLAVGATHADETTARNMILMIGDGMGPVHVQLTADFAGQPLAMDSLPVRGALQTRSADQPITDSAAAATAIGCGRKTNNGMLGKLPDGSALPTLAERARNAGKRVGVVSSVAVNQATPAAFYAKADSRKSFYAIGLQAFASRFDVLGGNGLSDANGANENPRPTQDLWQVAAAAGYACARTPAQLAACAPGTGLVFLAPERVHAETGVPYGRPFDPARDVSLAQMTAKALELLDAPAGFFLMVEGGSIDKAAHANDSVGVVAETLAFDAAVAVARAFAETHPGTLLVVTADHETGGLTLREGVSVQTQREILSRQTESRDVLAGWLRSVIAGTAALQAEPWDAVRDRFAATLGAPDPGAYEGLAESFAALQKAQGGDVDKAGDALLRAAFKLRDTAAGLAWSTGGHTAADVPLRALGPGADRFGTVQDNTHVATLGALLLGLPALP